MKPPTSDDDAGHNRALQRAYPAASGDAAAQLRETNDDGADTSLASVIPGLLDTVRHALGMDVAFVSEFAAGQRVFRHVALAGPAVIHAGGADPLDSSWCQKVVDGRLPRFIPDTAVHYERGDVAAPPFPIGTHLSVPIVLGDGHTFGTLCCFSFERQPDVREADLGLLQALARFLAVAEDRIRAQRSRPPMADASPSLPDVATIASIAAVPQLLEVVCRSTGMGFAAIARVTDRQWICCASRDDIGFGLQAGGELVLQTTLCNEIRQHGEPVVIDDVAASGRYCAHHTPAKYGFRSYISFPIFRADGSFWGTLCAIDPQPARLDTPRTRGMFRLFADLVGFHLEANDRLEASASALRSETATARRREQFVAALGHDIRTPLQAIIGGLVLIERQPAQVSLVAPRMRRSVERINRLVEDLMDLARGQLGAGMQVSPLLCNDIAERLAHVVEETRSAWPGCRVDLRCGLDGPVWCDPARLMQAAGNLIGNAVTHGEPGRPVRVVADTEGNNFRLAVYNAGPSMSCEELAALFKPYFRPSSAHAGSGLGLGLYIVSEIARAHGGSAAATGQDGELTFTLLIPMLAPAAS